MKLPLRRVAARSALPCSSRELLWQRIRAGLRFDWPEDRSALVSLDKRGYNFAEEECDMRVSLVVTLLLLSSPLLAQMGSNENLKQKFPPDRVWAAKDGFNSSLVGEPQGRVGPDYPARCFFIRSYNFERRGTAAPKLKNMTTCTPAKSDQFRQTGKKPQVRLIPAK